MSRSLSRWQALVLGLIVLGGGLLAAVGVFSVGSRGWYGHDALTVRVDFPEVRGVEVGTRVRIQGIDAGEVIALGPPARPGAPVEVRLKLRADYRNLVRADATARIVSEGMIGAKVIELAPGSASAEPVEHDARVAAVSSPELGDLLTQVGKTLEGIQAGEGSLGKLARDPALYDALVHLAHDARETARRGQDALTSIQQDADALKRLPIVRGYVEDPVALLVRPRAERYRQVFAEEDLFEPGRAVLTTQGRRRLDDLAPWLNGLKHKDSDVVVVSYADPKQAHPATRTLTRQQSEAVADYLKKSHSIQKMGWFSSRKVTPLGQGTGSPPMSEKDALPPARVEVVVFVPQE